MDEYGLKQLQSKILDIAIYIDELCEENNIKYYLSGGCALGAIRHKGFVPWDDDLDIFMTSENYYKFIEVCQNQLDIERFYLQKENTEEWPLCFSKLRMNGTTYIEAYNEELKMHKGIFIDIYRLDNVSNNRILAYYQFICAKLLIASSLPRVNYSTTSKMKKAIMWLIGLLPLSFEKVLFSQVKKYNNYSCKRVGNFFHRGSYRSNVYPIEWLGKPRYVDFENIKLPVPEKVEEYLEVRFGDYNKIPDKPQRKVNPHVKFYDLEKDYSEY